MDKNSFVLAPTLQSNTPIRHRIAFAISHLLYSPRILHPSPITLFCYKDFEPNLHHPWRGFQHIAPLQLQPTIPYQWWIQTLLLIPPIPPKPPWIPGLFSSNQPMRLLTLNNSLSLLPGGLQQIPSCFLLSRQPQYFPLRICMWAEDKTSNIPKIILEHAQRYPSFD